MGATALPAVGTVRVAAAQYRRSDGLQDFRQLSPWIAGVKVPITRTLSTTKRPDSGSPRALASHRGHHDSVSSSICRFPSAS